MPILPVPYLSQTDNANHPGGTCNITSIAMVMQYWQIVGDGSGKQLEDQLYKYASDHRLVIGSPHDMVKIFEWKGMTDRYDTENKDWIQAIKKQIDKGLAVIIHTQFTPAGHIIVVIGYENNNLVCHDPYGRFSGTYGVWDAINWGPVTNPAGHTGQKVYYPYEMMERFVNIAGTAWKHMDITRPGFDHK